MAPPGPASPATQHSALSSGPSQDLGQIVWRKRIDFDPPYQGDGTLPVHYGSPVITDQNTVIVPIKLGVAGVFRIEARFGRQRRAHLVIPQ